MNSAETLIATLYDGIKSIEWLANNKKEQEFFVYCWDFNRCDFTIGIAYDAKLATTAKTVKVILDDGTYAITTSDQLLLLKDCVWCAASKLKAGDELSAFYKLPPNQNHNKLKSEQFPRIFTKDGWKQERQFIEEWKSGYQLQTYKEVQDIINMVSAGLTQAKIQERTGKPWAFWEYKVRKHGFSKSELVWLGKKRDKRRVIDIIEYKEVPVYTINVKNHKNFCGVSTVFYSL